MNTLTLKCTVTFKMQETPDNDPDVSHLEPDQYGGEDHKARLVAFRRGDWHMIGIRAVATVTVTRGGFTTSYEFKSPGLWGIESDGGPEYLQSVFEEECTALKEDLKCFKLLEV